VSDERERNGSPPSPTALNRHFGRQAGGQFGVGNTFAKGNPNNRRTQEIRNRLFTLASDERIDRIVNRLLEMAEAGDIHAMHEVLNRTIGKPLDAEPEPAEPAATNRRGLCYSTTCSRLRRRPGISPRSNLATPAALSICCASTPQDGRAADRLCGQSSACGPAL
jgi:hypothetical protein